MVLANGGYRNVKSWCFTLLDSFSEEKRGRERGVRRGEVE